METKVCIDCGNELLLVNFGKAKGNKDGLRNQCKKCRSKWSSQHYEENRDEIMLTCKQYKTDNKEAINIRRRINYSENKEVYAVRDKIYQQGNRETINKRKKIYRKINHVRVIEWNRNYNKEHPEISRFSSHRRRARDQSLPSTLTTEQWENTKLYFNDSCAYCEAKEALTQDHFMPSLKGGEYTKDNIIPACKSCNSSKGAKSAFDWYPKQPSYSESREKKILKRLGYKNQRQQLSIF